MIVRQDDGAADLTAVQRDDELLDRLGRRLDLDSDLFETADPAIPLLLALVRDVDENPVPEVEELVAAVPVAGRRRFARATAAAMVLGATLSVGGVAAAVTGDPFAPYRGIVAAFDDDGLPANAARVASIEKVLAGVRGSINRGQVGDVDDRLAAAREQLAELDLPAGQRRALERRLRGLEAAAAAVSAEPAEDAAGTPDAPPAAEHGQQNSQQPNGSPGKPEQAPKPEQAEKAERPGKPEQAPKPEQPEKAEQAEKAEKADKAANPAKVDKPEKPEQAGPDEKGKPGTARPAPAGAEPAGPATRSDGLPGAGPVTVPLVAETPGAASSHASGGSPVRR